MSDAPPALIDPVDLTRDLIRRPSVTPVDAGAMDLIETLLTGLGFHCRRMPFEGIENLYARRGAASPNLCFAGHTDVVPTGSAAAWTAAPFEAEIHDGILYGRGAVDMKGGIAAWIAAVGNGLEDVFHDFDAAVMSSTIRFSPTFPTGQKCKASHIVENISLGRRWYPTDCI